MLYAVGNSLGTLYTPCTGWAVIRCFCMSNTYTANSMCAFNNTRTTILSRCSVQVTSLIQYLSILSWYTWWGSCGII